MKHIHLRRRFAAAALTAALALTPTAAFSDTEGHWAQEAIAKWSQDYSVIQGYEDGTFRPDAFITRGAFAGILDRFLKFRSASAPSTFSDTEGTYWEDSILKLHASGVYLGNNGKALPGNTITRQQAVTMLARAFHIQPTVVDCPYEDADQLADYAQGPVAEMTLRGWITDSADGFFRPQASITRAEFLNILNNMIQVLLQDTASYSMDVEGTVMLNAQGGAYLEEMTITGDLILAPGVTGNVTLSNVTIEGSIRNFSAVEPVLVTQPEEDEDPSITVVPIDPADSENPAEEDPGIRPSEVYLPTATTGEYLSYGSRSIPIYAGREASRLQPEDFLWNEDFTRLSYIGRDFDTRFGIDVSSYQNQACENQTIDWDAVANDGVDFVMVRIGLRGYGTGAIVEDKFYRQNIQGALDAGLDVGVYFFAQAITVEEALEEAEFVMDHLRGLDITGPVAYDWEMNDSSYRVYGTEPEMATACAIAFCQRIQAAGYTPMIYGGQYVSYVKYDQGAIAPYLSWYPEYKRESSEKLCPSFYYQMNYWQFTDSCSIVGINGRVDANLEFIPR